MMMLKRIQFPLILILFKMHLKISEDQTVKLMLKWDPNKIMMMMIFKIMELKNKEKRRMNMSFMVLMAN